MKVNWKKVCTGINFAEKSFLKQSVTNNLPSKIAIEYHIGRVNGALNSVQCAFDILTDCTVNVTKIFYISAATPSLLSDAVTQSSPTLL